MTQIDHFPKDIYPEMVFNVSDFDTQEIDITAINNLSATLQLIHDLRSARQKQTNLYPAR